MPEGKSEAQIRNEEEVKRILKERGYNSTLSKKQVSRTFGSGLTIAPFIAVVSVIAIVISGWFLLQNILPEISQDKIETSNTSYSDSELGQEYMNFSSCLSSIDSSEISLDDADFWNKYIERYEQTISCYDKYPSVASSTEKIDLQNKLSEFKENSKKAEANDAEYKANIAKIDAELEKNLAKVKEESDAWEKELQRRTQERQKQRAELDAEYSRQQEERERRAAEAEAQRQQQEQAAQAKCDDYISKYGDKTAQEIAEADSEVKRAKYDWTSAQKKIRNCSGGNIVYNQSQRELCNSYRDQEVQTAESLHSAYTNLLQQKTSYYRSLKISSCGY